MGLVREEQHTGTASRVKELLRYAEDNVMLGIRLFEKYTAHYQPTYKMARAGRFTNVLLAMMVMALFEKDLRMKAD